MFAPVRRALVRQVRRTLNDPKGERPVPSSDEALFAPGSVIRRVHADVTSMMVGGIAALLTQMLHPKALAGVWDHSDVTNDQMRRLRRTARFIATKLARRFISDDPPQTVIDNAAAVFLKTDGSIRETLRAIITSPEFFSTSTYRAKMRSPLEYVAAAMRALNAETDGDRPVLEAIARMGQPVFGRITPDGYADRASQWLSSGAMVVRLNFASALATNRVKGTSVNIDQLLLKVDPANKNAVADKLISLTIFGDASNGTRAALEKTLRAEPVVPSVTPAEKVSVGIDDKGASQSAAPPRPATYISELVTLLIGSPEFQQR